MNRQTKPKKTLAQKRAEDAVMYTQYIQSVRTILFDPKTQESVRFEAQAALNRALRALEVSKLDPIAADRIFNNIDA